MQIEDGKDNLVYLDGALSYHDNDQSKTVYHQANICFHDNPSWKQNYFFAGNAFFYEEWTNFLDQVKLRNKSAKMYEFAVIPITSVSQKNTKSNYHLNYDMRLFQNYDGSPVKVYSTQINDHCEIYVGDFFMSRYLIWIF